MARRNRAVNKPGVYRDHQSRTCLLAKGGDQVKFIPLDISDGFQVHETTKTSFDQRYKEMPDYPLDKAAQLYLNYALAVGASEEVMEHLGQIINVTEEDCKMATSRRAEKPVPKKAAKSEHKPTRKKREVKSEPKEKPVRKRASRRAKKSIEAEYKSASAMFQGLIMDGKLTDDEIFAQVQQAFSLDDKKRSYVTWYRNNLKKKGENPPEAL